MGQPHIQTSFASGELAPKLRSRVDVAKYHTGAAMMRNFMVDYSAGGASTRQGTKWVLKTKSIGARLIGFQPSTSLSYVLEFGQNYIRFYSNGSPILETAVAIQSITGSPVTVNSTANGYANGDWVFISGNYYIVTNATTNSYQLTDLFGNNILALTGTQAQRVYTITSPYNASDLFPNPSTANPGLKFVQDVTSLIITHPSYPPQILTIAAAASWTISGISFGATIATPTNLVVSTTLTTEANQWNYAYLITAVDANGQESAPTAPVVLSGYQDLATVSGTNLLGWSASPGAVSYNVYKASPSYNTAIQAGAQYGFAGNVTGTAFTDTTPGVTADFSQTPPIEENPFVGAGVQSYAVTAGGTYAAGASVPIVTVAAPSSGGQATAVASMGARYTSIASGGSKYTAGQLVSFGYGIVIKVLTVSSTVITSLTVINPGSITAGALPSNPLVDPNPPLGGSPAELNFSWFVNAVNGVGPGSGYITVPAVSFSSGAATATATLAPSSAGNPGVPGFFQERLMLANQPQSVQDYNLSQPGSFFNYNVSNPSEDDDAISGTIISEELNDIRNLVAVPTGIIAFTGRGAWLINGGGGLSVNDPITPNNQVASAQAFNGANDLKPIKINFDVLYGTNKGNYVRDLSYNIYAAIFSGSDISVWSNHLFFGYYMLDWAWAEEPFKTLWAIRADGTMLSLAYVKEQELIGWARHDTNGQFTSVCSVIETVGNGNVVDAVYLIVQRVINGQTVQYVERMADRYFTHGYVDSWSVDCALQTTAQSKPANPLTITGDVSTIGNVVTLADATDAPFTSAMATNSWLVHTNDGGIYEITAFTSTSQVTAEVVRPPNFFNQYTNTAFVSAGGLWALWEPITDVTGLQQLVGQNVYGVADGAVVGPLLVSAGGSVTLTTPASKITLGLPFLPQLMSLPLEPATGKGTSQGKRKKFPDITLRVADTLGLEVGTSFANAVPVKDFQIGAIPSLSTGPALVTDLVNPSTGPNGQVTDGFTVNDPLWQEAGQLCIQQNLPYPATILGIIPDIAMGDEP